MSSFSPITFFSPSSVIDYGQVGRAQNPSDKDVKQAFLKLLLEKIYLNNFMAEPPADNSNNDEDISVFNKDMSNAFVNDLFREQIANQMSQDDVFDIKSLGGTN